jgi:lactate permease
MPPHIWQQNYDPFGNVWLSTLTAAVPLLLLFYLLAVRRTAAHIAATLAAMTCALLAVFVFHMPLVMAAGAVASGWVYGIVRVGWVVLAAVFVYELCVESGHFEIIKHSIGGVTADRRLQVLLIAFAFGAVLEGAGGGGAPVAIAGSMMIGLGFDPFAAALLCLIANTAPVAFGGLGNPVRTLTAVTGIPAAHLSAMMGRILPFTALILPFWLIRSMCKWSKVRAVWPGLLCAGVLFASIQFYWSNFQDYGLVDIIAGMVTLVGLTLFFKIWKPAEVFRYECEPGPVDAPREYSTREVIHAWSPFLLLSLFVIVWGVPAVTKALDTVSLSMPVPGLDKLDYRMPPVMLQPKAESAVFDFAWLSGVGTGTFFAGLITGPLLGLSMRRTLQVFFRTCYKMRAPMLAIMSMLALGFTTRYSGMDAVMALALANTGPAFPFFGTLIGWLGVALTGTDAGSNALFGSLQVITANKLGLDPTLMAAANSAGGVMGKMIAAQSVVVATAAVGLQGREGDLFRKVLPHSIALASLVGAIVFLISKLGASWIPH